MKSYVITKKQLIEFVNEQNNKQKQLEEASAVRVKKEDVDLYGTDEDHKAWVELVSTPDDPLLPKQPKVVRVSSQQFGKILDYVSTKHEMRNLY